MSTTELNGRESTATEQYVRYSPFQDSYTFEAEPSLLAEQAQIAPAVTPFVSEYAGEQPEMSPEGAQLHELLFELYDQEFDAALGDIAQEAWAAANERAEMFGETAGSTTAEQFLEQWVAPCREQAEALIDNVASAVDEADIASMSESEIDRLLEQFEPRGAGLEPHFEGFLGGLFNKVKKVVKTAGGFLAKGLTLIPGFGFLLNKLKALVKPLLDRVLRWAIDKLPPQLRPVARQLAQRIFGREAEEWEANESEHLATPQAAVDPTSIQHQFDLDVASLLFAPEPEQEAIVTEAAGDAQRFEGSTIAELQEARAQFIDELERGVDPQQALENFLPAIMAVRPIARMAIGIIGRPRVVNFLAQFLAQLIGKYIPRDAATQLSRAIVDTGLRMLTLEAPSEAEVQQLAPAAIAATVEDTVRRLAELDEATLEQPQLFEAAATAAFHEAAAENFPSQMLIPELQEATVPGAWVPMPLGRRRKYYKKYTRIFDVQITPQIAGTLRTFGGTTIAAFLRDRLGVTPPVQARVHLYQAITGTTLGRIARLERGVRGLGVTGRAARSQFHPLTPEAAGILLQQPRLGRRVSGMYVSSRGRIAAGQRFYYLEIAGARAPTAITATGVTPAIRRSSEVNVTLDFPKDEFRVFVYLSEADSQQIAAKLRSEDVTGVILAARRIYEAGVATALGGDIQRHVKIRSEALPQEQLSGGPIQAIGQVIKDQLARRITQWVGKAITEYVNRRAGDFIAATENAADGVTLVVTIINPPGAPLVRRLLRGEGIGPEAFRDIAGMFRGDPRVTVSSVPGFRFD